MLPQCLAEILVEVGQAVVHYFILLMGSFVKLVYHCFFKKNIAEKLFLYLYWDLPEFLPFETASLEDSSCTTQLQYVCLVCEHLALIL